MFNRKKYIVVGLYGEFGWVPVGPGIPMSYKMATRMRDVILDRLPRDPDNYAVVDVETYNLYVQIRRVVY